MKTIAIVLATVAYSLGSLVAADVKPASTSSCCGAGAPCCYEGSPCCK